MKNIVKVSVIVGLMVVSFLAGKKDQSPSYRLSFLAPEVYGQVDGQNITFADLSPEVQMNLIRLESQKQEILNKAIPEILLAKMINSKKMDLASLNSKIEISNEEINQYIRDNKLSTQDSSLPERVHNKLLEDKISQMKQKAIDSYSQKVEITLNEPSLKELSLNTKNSLNHIGTKKDQIVVFTSLDDQKSLELIQRLIKEHNEVNISLFPLTSVNPYRDESLKKFICLKDQKTPSIQELNNSISQIISKYNCNEQQINNQVYNVSNYAKSIGIYSPGLLVNGQWLNFDEKLSHNIHKRLLK